MIPSIARQSVIHKCNIQKSVLLGNYEFYYLAGLLHKLYHIPLTEDLNPDDMFAAIATAIPDLDPQDEREKYLLKLVKFYEPLPDYDAQMRLLFRWGAQEGDMWQLQTSYSPKEA